jgi:hypothetical protein
LPPNLPNGLRMGAVLSGFAARQRDGCESSVKSGLREL